MYGTSLYSDFHINLNNAPFLCEKKMNTASQIIKFYFSLSHIYVEA